MSLMKSAVNAARATRANTSLATALPLAKKGRDRFMGLNKKTRYGIGGVAALGAISTMNRASGSRGLKAQSSGAAQDPYGLY